MTSFWLADRNRSDEEDRTPPRVRKLLDNIEDAREALVAHPVYSKVDSVENMHVFMSFHIWAVWDFMCLLKGLQVNLSCVQVPWFPKGDRTLRRLVNEIVVAEETDEDGRGGLRGPLRALPRGHGSVRRGLQEHAPVHRRASPGDGHRLSS
jgi:hypothetical protein